MKWLFGLALVFLCSAHVHAIEWKIGKHVTVSPSDDMDVTFQIFEEFDPNEEVLLGWNGDVLEYMMTVDEQPSGYSSEQYWQGLIREYQAMVPEQNLTISQAQNFTNDYHGHSTFKVLSWQEDGEEYTQLIGLVLGQKYAYWFIVQPWMESGLDEVKHETLRLMQSAEIK